MLPLADSSSSKKGPPFRRENHLGAGCGQVAGGTNRVDGVGDAKLSVGIESKCRSGHPDRRDSGVLVRVQTRECEPRELFGPRVMAPVAGESPRIEEEKHMWNFQCCESWPKGFRVSYACADAGRREYESPLGVWTPPYGAVCPRTSPGEASKKGGYL